MGSVAMHFSKNIISAHRRYKGGMLTVQEGEGCSCPKQEIYSFAEGSMKVHQQCCWQSLRVQPRLCSIPTQLAINQKEVDMANINGQRREILQQRSQNSQQIHILSFYTFEHAKFSILVVSFSVFHKHISTLSHACIAEKVQVGEVQMMDHLNQKDQSLNLKIVK